MLIDTHAHLDYEDFAADFDAVLQRARDAGVQRVVTIGTSVESSRRAVALAERYPMIFAVVGVHPTTADEAETDVTEALRELAKHPRVCGIGETGLDYHRPPEDAAAVTIYKARQADVFRQQLEVAAEAGLNVVIHQRDAWEDTLNLLQPYSGQAARGVPLLRRHARASGGGDGGGAPGVVHRHRHLQKRGRCPGNRGLRAGGSVHGGDGLPVPRAGAVPGKTLRTSPHPRDGGGRRGGARDVA